MDGTLHGGPDEAAQSRPPLDDADTAPQPALTPEHEADAAAALAAHHHERTPEHHHEAPHGVVEHPLPRHAAASDVVPPTRRSWVRTAAVLAAVVLVVGTASAWALTRGGTAPSTAQPSTSGTPSASSTVSAIGVDPDAAPGITQAEPMLAPAQDTLVLGDSLGLTVYPFLADLVPDRYVSYEAEVGRTTSGTLTALRRLGTIPPVVIVSSGTNDPTGAELETHATEILDLLGPDRCVVWVDVVRPESQYDSATVLNAAIDRATSGRPNVSVLQWTELVATHPGWMGGDGIHPNREGSQGRAEAFAAAAQSCSPLDPQAPTARKQILPLSAFYGPIAGGGGGGGTTSSSSGTPAASQTSAAAPAPSPSASVTPPQSSAPATTAPAPTTSAPKPTTSAPAPPPTTAPAPAPTASAATAPEPNASGAAPSASG